MAKVAAIYRYPVKGLSAEPLAGVALAPGRCLPHDRRFAVALPTTRFDPAHPEWLAKRHFVMLMRDEKLAALTTRFAEDGDELTIAHKGAVVLRASLSDAEGSRAVGAFLSAYLAPEVEGPLRVVTASDHTFADARRQPGASADQYVSLINLGSVAVLEAAIGAPVDPLRFRANVYFAGEPAWSELGWVGGEIVLDDARLKIVSAITRCAATEVNPQTAARDLDVVGALERAFRHNLMGVYGEVVAGGAVAVGGELTLDPTPVPRSSR